MEATFDVEELGKNPESRAQNGPDGGEPARGQCQMIRVRRRGHTDFW